MSECSYCEKTVRGIPCDNEAKAFNCNMLKHHEDAQIPTLTPVAVSFTPPKNVSDELQFCAVLEQAVEHFRNCSEIEDADIIDCLSFNMDRQVRKLDV